MTTQPTLSLSPEMTLDQANVLMVDLMGQAQKLRKSLSDKATASWEGFASWCALWTDMIALERWAEFHAPSQASVTPEELKGTLRAWEASRRRLGVGARRMGVAHVLRGWMRRINNPLSQDQRGLVEWALDKMNAGKASVETSEKLERRQFRRLEKHVARVNFNHAIVLTRKQAMDLPPEQRRLARLHAEKIGVEGFAVMPHEDLGRDVLWYVSDRRVRQDVWTIRQFLADDDRTVSELLQARHKEAKKAQHASAVHYSLFGSLITKPRSIASLLTDGLDGVGKMNSVWGKVLTERAKRLGIDQIEPWDMDYLCHFDEREPAKAFALDATLRGVVGELAPMAGFELRASKVVGTGAARRWRFDLMGATGPAQVWISPFYRTGFINRDDAGFAVNIVDRWHGEDTQMPVAGIQLTLAPTDRFMDWSGVRILCHELGHAFHMLRLPGNKPEEMDDFPQDIVELPSQLMEQVVYDPSFLTRIGQKGTRAAWAGFLRRSMGLVSLWQRDVRAADVDLHAHLHKNPKNFSIREFVAQRSLEKNLVHHPLDNTHITQFAWSGGYAGTSYTYPLSMAVVETLATRRKDLSIDAQATGQTWLGLADEVLSQAVDRKQIAKAWMAWQGEDVLTQAKKGMNKRTQMLIKKIKRS